MDSGDVEFSGGAVDFNPNESSSKNSGGPVDNIPVEKVAAEDVHFHASDITKLDEKDFFDDPKRRKQREKEEQKRIRAEAKRVAKESKKHSHGRKDGVSKEIAESEQALRREQSRIEGEHRKARMRAFLGRRLRRWYLYVGAIVIALITVCAFIFVPGIIQGIQNAENNKYIEENRTPILSIFKEVAGKELSEEEIGGLVAEYNGELITEFYPQAGAIYPKGTYLESVKMFPKEGAPGVYHLFSYVNKRGDRDALISKEFDGFVYARDGNEQRYETLDEAINALILDTRGDRK